MYAIRYDAFVVESISCVPIFHGRLSKREKSTPKPSNARRRDPPGCYTECDKLSVEGGVS